MPLFSHTQLSVELHTSAAIHFNLLIILQQQIWVAGAWPAARTHKALVLQPEKRRTQQIGVQLDLQPYRQTATLGINLQYVSARKWLCGLNENKNFQYAVTATSRMID